MAEKKSIVKGQDRKPIDILKYDNIPVEKRAWLTKEGYFDLEALNRTVIKFFSEYKYSGKWQSNMQLKNLPQGKEGEFEFEAKRNADPYHKYIFNVKFIIMHMKTVTVEKNGKKVPMNHGWIHIIFDCYFEKNWGTERPVSSFKFKHNKEIKDGEIEYSSEPVLSGSSYEKKPMFSKAPFSQFLKYLYDRYVIKRQTLSHFGKLRIEVQELSNRLKKSLDMEYV